ncbi:MAG: energy transducer TonB [Pyrinomonadaceae bacterium]|nr:energy transducer TonB [Pyrinomonadaceae bacterium]
MLKTSRLPWLIGGLVVLAAISIVFIIGYNMGSEKVESLDGNNTNSENSNPLTPPAPIPQSVDASNVNQGNTGIGSGNVSVANGNTAPSSEAGVKPVDDSKIFKPSEVDQKARLLSKPAPEYTVEARQNQVTGTVVLQVVLSSKGTVENIRAVNGLPYGLTEKAIAAAKQIKFTPAMKDGRAVSQYIKIEYNFNIY